MEGTVEFSEVREKLRGFEHDRDKIIETVKQYSSLPVKIALLALATEKRMYSPYWIGCPPGVFLSYKWNGPESKEYVARIHDHLTSLGYRVYFDQNELDETADTYTSVPQYISSIGKCQYYVLLLTEKTADFITARQNKTSWIFDEYQQAIKLVNIGRLWLVPLLIEPGGAFGQYGEMCIDLTDNIYDFAKLDSVFQPVHFNITREQQQVFSDFLDGCDVLFFKKQWDEARQFFDQAIMFKNFPDYQFKLLVLSICIGDLKTAEASFVAVREFIGQDPTRLLKAYADIYQTAELAEYLSQGDHRL